MEWVNAETSKAYGEMSTQLHKFESAIFDPIEEAADTMCDAFQGSKSTSVSSNELGEAELEVLPRRTTSVVGLQAAAERRRLEKEAEHEAKRKEAKEKRLAKEAATEEKRLAKEAAAEEKRLAAEAAAEEKRLAKEAAAEEKRLSKEAASQEKRLAKEVAAEEKRKAAEEKKRIAREAKEAAKKKKKKNAAGTKKNAADCSILGSTFPSVFDDEGYIKCLLPEDSASTHHRRRPSWLRPVPRPVRSS